MKTSLLSRELRSVYCSKRFLRSWTRFSLVPETARLSQHLCSVLCEVSDDEVGACAAKADKRLHHGTFLFEPAPLERGMQHRVLTRDLVSTHWQIEAVACCAEDIHVGHGGLHQE